jgi:hypothetical protein
LVNENLVGLGDILAELASGIHLSAEHVRVADAEHAPEAEPDAEKDVLLRGLPLVVALRRLLHFDRRLERLVGVAEDDQETVAIDLQQDPVVCFDDRNEDSLGFVDRLKEVDNAELRHAPRKPGEVGDHHAPLFTEQIPEALVDRLAVRGRLEALGDQLLEPVLGGGVGDSAAEEHSPLI